MTTEFFFKLLLLNVKIPYTRGLECPADGEAERGVLFEEREIARVKQASGGLVGRVVGEQRRVRDDGRLQILAHVGGVVGEIYAERRIYHGEHYLQLQPGGSTDLLGA